MNKRSSIDMTVGSEWKCIVLFAFPIFLSMVLQQLYNTVDGIIVGNFVSSGALAAVGNCAVLANIFIMGSNGLANGSGVVVSQFYGARRIPEMQKAAGNAIALLSALGLFFAVLVSAFAGFAASKILHIEADEICDAATVYIRVYAIGFLFTFVYNAIAAILRAMGDSKAVLYFLLVSTIANSVLDVLFVAGFKMGVSGAALATVIAQALCVVVSFWYMYRKYPEFRFTAKELSPEKKTLAMCLKMGLPGAIQMVIISGGHLFLQRLVNTFGEATMAAFVVGTRFDNYCTTPCGAFMQAMASFTGQNTGAGKQERIKRGIRYAVGLDFIAVAILSALLWLTAPTLAKLFGVSGDALLRSVEMMRFLAFCFPIFAIYLPLNGLFQGAGDPIAATVASLTALGVRVSLSYILVYFFAGTYEACWTPQGIGWSVSVAFCAIHYFRGGWKKKSLVARG